MFKWVKSIFKKNNNTIVVVSGLPRSGTSLMMKMLEAGGIPPLTDDIRTPDDDNPRGYYEFERAKKLKEGDIAWLPEAQGKAVKVISALLMHLPSTYQYKVIFMRRTLSEVLASQRKMLVNRGEDSNKVSDDELEKLFEKHLQEVTGWLAEQPNFETLYINFNELMGNPEGYIEQINCFMEGHLHASEMGEVIDPNLYRQRV